MTTVSVETLDALKEFDAATLFNAVVASMGGSQGGHELDSGGGVPVNYTGPEVVSMLPELGSAIGTVVTTEVTTNDPDSAAIPWDEYYDALEATPGPIIAVMRDVDTRPGRGACFGDGMAWRHRMLGVAGAVVEGSVRDLAGIRDAGLPIWGTGRVPGHGVFNLISVNRPISRRRASRVPRRNNACRPRRLHEDPARDRPGGCAEARPLRSARWSRGCLRCTGSPA